jgi:hypothetical protein
MALKRVLSMRQEFLAQTQHASKIQNGEYQPQSLNSRNFFPVPKSPTQIQDLLMLKTRGRKSQTWAPLTSFTLSTYTILGKAPKEGDQQGAQLFCIGSHEGKQSVFRYSVWPPCSP